MNVILKDLGLYSGRDDSESMEHYGVKRRSGRYPWGSGDNPYQHSGDFLSRVEELRANPDYIFTDEDGKTYTGELAIAKSLGLSTTEYRTALSVAKADRRKLEVDRAKSLRADGKSLAEIAKIMGYENDSSIRSLLNADSEARMNQAEKTAESLKKLIEEKGMIDVGAGIEQQLGISRAMLDQAIYRLELEGYPLYGAGVPQVTNKGKQTNLKVICPKGTEYKEIYNFENIHNPAEDIISHDGGETFDPKFVYPESMDSSRLKIRYADEGGKDKDGVIEIRRGVEDLDLGESHYAQVRILVDGTHYLKGMAVYSDDMPEGTDIIFNTNKNSDTPTLGPKGNSILKPIKNDPDNPFGSLLKEGVYDPDDEGEESNYIYSKKPGQSYYYDKDGNKKLSLINKTREEGDWEQWSKKLPSQFLSKQPQQLIDKQLDLSIKDKQAEYDEIISLTNPTVKKALLSSFAEDCDKAAVHLQAAALPRQKYQVILPLTSIKDNEVYAPNYEDGETVALIRYPHGGTFEIPILKVNNKNKEGNYILTKNAKDAIGINSKVAERLSGADFDGDTVMVIPCNSSRSKVRINSTHELADLKGFDPKLEYGGKPEGTFKRMKNTQTEMGKISNLITDMTLKGATEPELARAVKHSMVVIDAEKHGLDYKQSEKDNGIPALKKKYQGHIAEDGKYHEGASTLISAAKSKQQVLKRKGTPTIDKETGELKYKEVVETYTDKKGKEKVRMQDSTKMAETKDARTLISDRNTPVEIAYANYANTMKSMANQARKEMVNTKEVKRNPSAAETYAPQVASLKAQLNNAKMNAPKERQAQLIANTEVKAKKQENPDMSRSDEKKIAQQALTNARARVGAKRTTVEITEKEWEAIQAGAISPSELTSILNNADIDKVRVLATPRTSNQLSTAKQAKIKSMQSSGYTNAEIADALGVSTSTVMKYS